MIISLVDNTLVIKDDGKHLVKIRALPARRWVRETSTWHCPYVKEVYQAMQRAGFPVGHLAAPTESGYTIDRPYGEQRLVIKTLGTVEDIQRCKRIPEFRSWSPQHQAWICKPTKGNVQYLTRAFPQATWGESAKQLVMTFSDDRARLITQHAKKLKESKQQAIRPIDDYQFYSQPFEHQRLAFQLMRDQRAFALLMEMGTGKGKVVVDDAAYQLLQHKIDGLLIICPNAMKDPWEEEIEKHLPPEIKRDVFIWEAKTRHKAESWIFDRVPGELCLKILVMNVEALSGESGAKIADLFAAKHRTYMVVDESTTIKSPNAARTKKAITIGKRCLFRRILTGTPITQGPLDLFSQFKFLDPAILGHSSFYSFRQRYAILGGFQGKQVVGYSNLEELTAKVDVSSYRVLKADCLDLPPKVYEKRVIELTTEQRRLYDEMASSMKAELAVGPGEQLTAAQVMHAITKIMRMQQIVGGFLAVEDPDVEDELRHTKPIPIPGGNPKLADLLELIEEGADNAKYIIWARFKPELRLISQTLETKYGAEAVAKLYGGISDEERRRGKRSFQEHSSGARFFVGQQGAGGKGITLVSSSIMVYFSNDHSLENRIQSEDRFHRIGQAAEKCTIIDIMARKTSDYRIVGGLRSKKSLADLVTGDPTLSWL